VNPSTDDAGLNIFDIQSFMVVDAKQSIVDLWGEYIKKVFLAIVNTETIWGDSPNDSADDALNKMDDNAVFDNDATNVLPLRFEESAGSADQKKLFLGEYVAQAVGRILLDQWQAGGSSLWDTLISCARAFGFHVVPLIETAACCPVYGALAGDPYKTLTADDYTSINLQSDAQMMVTKFVVIAAGSSYSSTRSPTPRESGHVGIYDISTLLPKDDNVSGQTLVAQAPAWLAYETEIGEIVRESLGGDALAIGTAENPNAFEKEPETDSQQIYNELLNDKVGDYYAQARLQEANLQPRYGALGGRFRLDIAPGSTVKFEVIDDKFADAEAEPKYMYGLVTQVTLDLTAGRTGPTGSATTIFSLNYVRTEEEHAKDYMVSQNHPVWSNDQAKAKFLGTKLWKE
jgi:hypothetical protein